MQTFADLVENAFGFLVTEYGFQRVRQEAIKVGEATAYVKVPLTVKFGWYKGEVDIGFEVSLEFSDAHRVFRPYLSRSFHLHEVALRQDPNAYAHWASVPGAGASILTPGQAERYLAECAGIMHKFCAHLLQGDLSQLEAITLERKARTK